MPLPGTQGALYFKGTGVTDFLDYFELIANTHKIPESDRAEWVYWYTEDDHRHNIELFGDIDTWDRFKIELKREFAHLDPRQNTTWAYSELLRFYGQPIGETPAEIYEAIDRHDRLRFFFQDNAVKSTAFAFFQVVPRSVRQAIHNRVNKTLEGIMAWEYCELRVLLMTMLQEDISYQGWHATRLEDISHKGWHANQDWDDHLYGDSGDSFFNCDGRIFIAGPPERDKG